MPLKLSHLLIGSAAAWVLYQAVKVRRVARIIFFPAGIDRMDFVGSSPVITFRMRMQNTSSEMVRVNSLAGNMTFDGVLIGNVALSQILEIPANSERVVDITAYLSPLGIVNTLIDSFVNRDFSKEVLLSGFANIDGLQLPIEMRFNLGV